MSAAPYIPGFDGLRAVAAIVVIAFHLKIPGFSLGWSGVYLFFVLSGFLITRILLNMKGHPRFFRTFYWRRSLRIFPIYYCALAVAGLLALQLNWPISDWPWYALYAQNWLLASNGFRSDFPELFNHTWTLAVEEQFYLLWPMIVFACSPPTLRMFLAWLIGACFVARFINGGAWPILAFDALAWGCLAALIFPTPKSVPRSIAAASLAASAAILILIVARHGIERFWFPSGYIHDPFAGALLLALLGPCFASLLLLVFASRNSLVLEAAPLRYAGRISYGLYLYHWPIILLYDSMATPNFEWAPVRIVLISTLTLAVATLSYEFMERPILRLRDSRRAYVGA